jgi:hypothetical protein
VDFADENQADTGFTYLFNCDALHDVGWGDTPEQVMFDTTLHGIYRTEQEFWEGIIKPALAPLVPLSVEFTIPPTDYSETIYP